MLTARMLGQLGWLFHFEAASLEGNPWPPKRATLKQIEEAARLHAIADEIFDQRPDADDARSRAIRMVLLHSRMFWGGFDILVDQGQASRRPEPPLQLGLFDEAAA